jgi:prephenate dehydratase
MIPPFLDIFQAGDRSSIENEILCRFVIPDRPGALMKLLDAFRGRWNISMLNYRGQVLLNILLAH